MSPPTVRVKICGLTRSEDVRLAVALGADYLGFIFAPSPRQITPRRAAEILDEAQTEGRGSPAAGHAPGQRDSVEKVGVFVNAKRSTIRETAEIAGLTMLQLHGDEEPDFCRGFELPLIKALRMKDRGIFELIERYSTPYILLEPYVRGRYGGSGRIADWGLAAEVVRTFPGRRFFLAGGIGARNARAAIDAVQPYAVDASSALEREAGIKDREKLKAFFEAARNR